MNLTKTTDNSDSNEDDNMDNQEDSFLSYFRRHPCARRNICARRWSSSRNQKKEARCGSKKLNIWCTINCWYRMALKSEKKCTCMTSFNINLNPNKKNKNKRAC